jgi:transcriptional regulator with XRE-family HTH domain
MYNENNYLKNFSKNLRQLRIKKKISQLEVCLNANISRTQYQSYESLNPTIPRLNSVIKLANFYNVSIDELLK